MRVRVYNATFTKQSGEKRTMNFVKYEDLTEDLKTSIFKANTEGQVKQKRSLQEGCEMVFDCDAKQIRIFNSKTVIGQVTSDFKELSL